MDVLLKGMKMPKSCIECPLETDYVTCGYYLPTKDNESDHQKRPVFCPLIEVPKHGRLIDADALINALQELFDRRNKDAEYTGFHGASVSWNDAICYIKEAPTIIPAEEGEG